MLAYDAEELPTGAEIELHSCLVLALVNKVVVALGARAAPQRPGDSIDYGGFTGAVIAGDASGVDGREAKRRRIALIRHEIAHPEIDWNHAVSALPYILAQRLAINLWRRDKIRMQGRVSFPPLRWEIIFGRMVSRSDYGVGVGVEPSVTVTVDLLVPR